MSGHVFAAPTGTSFITCDDPFTVVPPPFFDDSIQGYGILTPGASTVVPLSSKTAICFYGEGDRTRGAVVYRDFLRNVNMVVAANSERFVIACDEPLLRSVVRKGKLNEWQRPELEDFHEALKFDLEGLSIARASKVSEAETNSLINLGCDRTDASEPEKALESFGEAMSILESDVWCRWRFTLRLHAGLAAWQRGFLA